ncbi:MAG: histidine phosphatase family protein [Myxococcales bacterium]|nr:histidine phosphatase family protein [Myxococcales bacterium]
MKHLWLLRHAKAGGGAPDEGRRLNARGIAEARELAEHWAGEVDTPELALCSPARRTLETAEAVRAHVDPTPDFQLEPGLYLAAPGTILRAIATVGASCRALVVVGHNPGLADLAEDLALGGGPAAREMAARGFPPCALAHFELDIDDWSEVDGALARLVAFRAPDRARPR